MSHSVPQRPVLTEAARGDAPSTPHADRPLPDFPQHAPPGGHSPIEREIERSERASAALAAARALARASSNDSQLEGTDADGDIDTANWIRTEYASLDQSVRAPQEEVPHAGAPRNLVGGSFNPGIGGQPARPFATAPIGQSPIKTRGGAQARFLHESRHAPRAERPGAPATSRLDLSTGGAHYERPAVVPMLVNSVGTTGARPGASAPTHVQVARRAAPSEALKFAVAAGVGAIAVLLGGGLAWKAGWLSHARSDDPALITARVAAQAEAARMLSASQPEIAVVPAAGPAVTTAPHRSDEEINAALAAAARAAAVPVASVHAAGPARAVAPAPVALPVVATTASTAPAAVRVTPSANAAIPAPQHAPPPAKETVAAAIARAQARADSFLAAGTPATASEAPGEVKTAP